MEKFLLSHKFSTLDLMVLCVGILFSQFGYPVVGFLEILAGSLASAHYHEAWMRSRGG